MITAVDSNVLIDVLRADPSFGEASREALRRCRREGSLVACDIVWAELSAGVDSSDRLLRILDRLGLGFSPTDRATAVDAGRAWRAYRRKGGRRDRIIPDFLIGAHARRHADRLLSRDRGFYAACFRGLTLLDPSKA